jgi:protease-4
VAPTAAPPTIIIQQQRETPGFFSRLRNWLLYSILMISLLFNMQMLGQHETYLSSADSPTEKYHSGDKDTKDRIAIINVTGTIMPPLTARVKKDIKKAREDKLVKAVVLQVNSPGGLVSDSHEIYHELQKLAKEKPIVCSMQGLAASGGLYIAMGVGKSGKIIAEPTTWTGSIGVIIPRYEAAGLAEKVGIKATPLKTGPYKDALSPFRPMTEDEEKVWRNILNQAFEKFLEVIDENRDTLKMDQVKALATGEIYTAKDALAKGLIDAIGFEEDALEAAKKSAGLEKARVVTYTHAVGLLEIFGGSSQSRAPDTEGYLRAFLDAAVPRAMYYFSWAPALPGTTP